MIFDLNVENRKSLKERVFVLQLAEYLVFIYKNKLFDLFRCLCLDVIQFIHLVHALFR